MSSARLLARIAPLLDRSLLAGFLVPTYLSLADDPVMRVRKVAV